MLGLDGRDARPYIVILARRFIVKRHDPDVWRLCVRREVYIHSSKEHPFAVGRDLRLLDALQLHHVFKGEGMFGLGEGRKSK